MARPVEVPVVEAKADANGRCRRCDTSMRRLWVSMATLIALWMRMRSDEVEEEEEEQDASSRHSSDGPTSSSTPRETTRVMMQERRPLALRRVKDNAGPADALHSRSPALDGIASHKSSTETARRA